MLNIFSGTITRIVILCLEQKRKPTTHIRVQESMVHNTVRSVILNKVMPETTAISSREQLKRDLEKEPLKGINMAKNVMKNIESNLKMTAASIEKKAGYEGEARRRAVAHGSKISKNGNL